MVFLYCVQEFTIIQTYKEVLAIKNSIPQFYDAKILSSQGETVAHDYFPSKEYAEIWTKEIVKDLEEGGIDSLTYKVIPIDEYGK